MVFQNEIWVITLIGMGLVTLGFLFVVSQARRPADAKQAEHARKTSNVLRRWLFWALLILGIGVAYGTLHQFPIPEQHGPLQATQVVDVVGQQWAWNISKTTLPAGVPIEFRVTASDVNHGFAIYAPDGRIVTQTQAMPGYTNKLLYTFQQPGTYRILCLEYCGVAHHAMMTELHVVAATGGQS